MIFRIRIGASRNQTFREHVPYNRDAGIKRKQVNKTCSSCKVSSCEISETQKDKFYIETKLSQKRNVFDKSRLHNMRSLIAFSLTLEGLLSTTSYIY
ncbi:hypothetical protein V1477_018445 [Vespula maculifrons]|uniref:Uncharacterized protein n=1 Tax=Vespula maculifrons TaxID=7453 RepID=A0ABD2AVE0_VESMC